MVINVKIDRLISILTLLLRKDRVQARNMENLDVEMGFPVAEQVPGQGEIKARVIPGGKQVTCLYKGAYKDCGPAYDGVNRWIQEKGYIPTGVAYEFYYNSPDEVPESELLTKIMFPLK